MRRKENYPMRKLDVPKRVTLPNGRTFVARYERIKRRDLPADIQMKRTYKQRAVPRGRRRRRQRGQQGQGIVSVAKKVIKKSSISRYCKERFRICSGVVSKYNKTH